MHGSADKVLGVDDMQMTLHMVQGYDDEVVIIITTLTLHTWSTSFCGWAQHGRCKHVKSHVSLYTKT